MRSTNRGLQTVSEKGFGSVTRVPGGSRIVVAAKGRTDHMSTSVPPPRLDEGGAPPGSDHAPRWIWWLSVPVLVVLVALALKSGGTSDPEGVTGPGGDEASDCMPPAEAWIDTLEGAFSAEHVGATVHESAYIEKETTDETPTYYVAVRVEGVPGIAVFGTSDPPLQGDAGTTAVANDSARQLSDLGAAVAPDSPLARLLMDPAGAAEAEFCLK